MENTPIKGVIVHVLRRTVPAIEFLYLQRSGGTYKDEWWPVAGTCKQNETALACALRELREETGLEALSLYNLGMDVPHIDQTSKLKGFVAFVDGSANITLNYEHSNYQWLSTEKVLALLPTTAFPFIRHVHEQFILREPDESQRVRNA